MNKFDMHTSLLLRIWNWLVSHFPQVIERPQYLSFEVLEVLQQLIVKMLGESALVFQQTQQLRAQILLNLLDFHSNRLEIVEATVLWMIGMNCDGDDHWLQTAAVQRVEWVHNSESCPSSLHDAHLQLAIYCIFNTVVRVVKLRPFGKIHLW